MGQKIDVLQPPISYEIDWDSVNSLEDLKAIFSCLGLSVGSNHPDFDILKPYLKLY